MKYIFCGHCGRRFRHLVRRGPMPRWCSASCRQKAFRARREERLVTEAVADTATAAEARLRTLIETNGCGCKVCPTHLAQFAKDMGSFSTIIDSVLGRNSK